MNVVVVYFFFEALADWTVAVPARVVAEALITTVVT